MQSISIHTESANLTEEQFFKLCSENKELRLERDANKNIIVMSPTGSNTGKYNFKLALSLGKWNEQANNGHCFDSSTGFTLPNGAMRSPDVSWIANERWNALSNEDKDRFAHICPDFVIELLSKTDSLAQTKEKMQEWISNGCRLAWLIDLENKTTHIYKYNTEIKQQSFETTLSGENVLEGFELKLNEIVNKN
jgi:Uma2 family endonuclease